MVQQLMDRYLELSARLQTTENRAQYFEAKVQDMQVEYNELNNVRTEELQRQERTDGHVQNLENELRGIKRKVDLMNYAYTTSMERVQTQVWAYPNEIGQFRHSISRARVVANRLMACCVKQCDNVCIYVVNMAYIYTKNPSF